MTNDEVDEVMDKAGAGLPYEAAEPRRLNEPGDLTRKGFEEK